MEEKLRGGKRVGAGRKPIDNPKETITLYVPKKDIWSFGNKEKLKEGLYGFIASKKMGVQDLTQSNVQIKPIEQPKTNYAVDTTPIERTPILSPFEAFKSMILKCRTIPEIEEVMKEVKSSLMVWKEKQFLESMAKEKSREFYND